MKNLLRQRSPQHAGRLTIGPHNRNKQVAIVLGAWITAAVVFFVWCGLQNNRFASDMARNKSELRAAVSTLPAKMKAAKDAGDAAATIAVLKEFSATVSQKSKELPSVPNVLGLYVGADAERADWQHLQSAAAAHAADLHEAADFIAYQSTVARELQGLALKSAAGYDQTIELANAWRDAIQSMQTQSKPASVTSIIATLLQKMEMVETTLRAMAELYKKTDTEGFKVKEAQLAAAIGEFSVLGEQISSAGAQLDAKLAASAEKLRQNL